MQIWFDPRAATTPPLSKLIELSILALQAESYRTELFQLLAFRSLAEYWLNGSVSLLGASGAIDYNKILEGFAIPEVYEENQVLIQEIQKCINSSEVIRTLYRKKFAKDIVVLDTDQKLVSEAEKVQKLVGLNLAEQSILLSLQYHLVVSDLLCEKTQHFD